MIHWPPFVRRIMDAHRIVLTSHVRPDGDCIGCEIAMATALRHLGKDVRIINPHPITPSLRFLDPENWVREYKSLSATEKQWLDTVDCAIALDTSSWAQLGDMAAVFRRKDIVRMVVDHHIPSDDLEAESFVDSTAEAAGCLVLQAIQAMNVPLTKTIASALFLSIATDTGWMRFSSVTASTFRTLATLTEAGAVPAELYRQLYEQDSLGRQRLVGKALSNIESCLNGKLLITHLLQSEFAAAGAHPSDSEDIVNILLQVAESQMAVMMVQWQDRKGFKLSFRSRCHVDCSALAKQFEGGGHKAAAGGKIGLPLNDAKNILVAAIETMMS